IDGNEVPTNLQTAYHLVGGVEFDIKDIEFNVEPWYKNFTRNIELNRVKKAEQDPDFIAGIGSAYGIDLSAKYSKNRFFFYSAASYQKILYKTLVAPSFLEAAEVQEYPPPFDRRFNLNLVSSYAAGKKEDIELSLRFNLESPFPFTQTQCFYENPNIGANGINTNYMQSNGGIGVLYANQLNGGRLSWYHRLDLSVKKTFTFTEFTNLETSFALTNAYNRNNIFYVERTQNIR